MMRLSCVAGRHDAGLRRVRNQGLEFGRCRGCGRDLVRSRAAWRGVPRGFRVVWRRPAAGTAEISDGQLLFDLPAAGRALALRAGPRRRKGRAAAALELAVLGAHCLAWAITDRVRAWLTALRAPPMATLRVLSLAAA